LGVGQQLKFPWTAEGNV